MTIERSNIKYEMWRKKVDYSIFSHGVTTIPKSYVASWNLEKYFSDNNGVLNKDDSKAKTIIEFNKNIFPGKVDVISPKGRKNMEHRLWFDDDLVDKLKDVFVMSHMRWIERELRKSKFKNPGKETKQLEREIPFWEFLDIEFDSKNKKFILVAHYVQEPTFKELFKNIAKTPKLKQIEDSIFGKEGYIIYKQDWKAISELETELGAFNTIYTLIDIKNKLLYIGETQDLKKRLREHCRNYPKWTHFRYDVLPSGIDSKGRVAIERMLIRSYATILDNRRGINTFDISEYTLINEKIDK